MRKYLCLLCVTLVLALSVTTAMGVCLKVYGSEPEPGERRFLPLEPIDGPYPLIFYLFAPLEPFCMCSGEYQNLWEVAQDSMLYLGEVRLEVSNRLVYIGPGGPLGLRGEKEFSPLAKKLPSLPTTLDRWEALNKELNRFYHGDNSGLVLLMPEPGTMPPSGYRPRFHGISQFTCEQASKGVLPVATFDDLENPLPGMRLLTYKFYQYTSDKQQAERKGWREREERREREEWEALSRQRKEQGGRQAGEQPR